MKNFKDYLEKNHIINNMFIPKINEKKKFFDVLIEENTQFEKLDIKENNLISEKLPSFFFPNKNERKIQFETIENKKNISRSSEKPEKDNCNSYFNETRDNIIKRNKPLYQNKLFINKNKHKDLLEKINFKRY